MDTLHWWLNNGRGKTYERLARALNTIGERKQNSSTKVVRSEQLLHVFVGTTIDNIPLYLASYTLSREWKAVACKTSTTELCNRAVASTWELVR